MNSSEKGIVLRVQKVKEADQIIKLLCQNGAVRDYYARNSLKSKKRFGGGVLEPLNYIDLVCKENQGLYILEEARILEDFYGLRASYDQVQSALKAADLVQRVCFEDLEQPEVFHLFGNFLRLLEKKFIAHLLLHFEIRLLHTIGMLPHQESFQSFLQTPLSKSEDLSLTEAILVSAKQDLRQYKQEQSLETALRAKY